MNKVLYAICRHNVSTIGNWHPYPARLISNFSGETIYKTKQELARLKATGYIEVVTEMGNNDGHLIPYRGWNITEKAMKTYEYKKAIQDEKRLVKSMKKINGYWVDDNNNKWSEKFYTEQQAKEKSNTLLNCKDCANCTDCKDCDACKYCTCCVDCVDCEGCKFCDNCKVCDDCVNCVGCKWCDNCIDCKGCNDCNICNGCEHCKVCISCKHCRCCMDCEWCVSCKGLSNCANNNRGELSHD